MRGIVRPDHRGSDPSGGRREGRRAQAAGRQGARAPAARAREPRPRRRRGGGGGDGGARGAPARGRRGARAFDRRAGGERRAPGGPLRAPAGRPRPECGGGGGGGRRRGGRGRRGLHRRRGADRPAGRAADGERPAVAVARPVDDPERPDLRREPRQRLRPRLGGRRRPLQSGARALRRGERRRLGELRPRRQLVAAHRLRRHPDRRRAGLRPPRPGHCLLRHRRGQLVVLARRRHPRRPTAARPGRRSAPRRSSARASTTWSSTRPTAAASARGHDRRALRLDRRRRRPGRGGARQRPGRSSMAPAGGTLGGDPRGVRDGLFRSTNGGTTWTAVALPGAPAAFDRLAVAIAPSNPDVAYAWGAQRRHRLPVAARRRHLDGGRRRRPGVSTGQAWYDWFLAVAPDRDTQIYCGAIEVHRGDLSGTTWTWTQPHRQGPTGDSIHPDQHAIAFEPGDPNTIYVGNDGGLYRSADRGITWQHCNNGLVIREFEYLAQDYGSSRWLIGGTQDNGTERWTGSRDHGTTSPTATAATAASTAPTPQPCFHTYYGMSPERSTTGGDFGSWTWIAAAGARRRGQPVLPAVRVQRDGRRHDRDRAATRSTSPATTAPPGRGSAFPTPARARARCTSRTPTRVYVGHDRRADLPQHLDRRQLGARSTALDHAARGRLRQRPATSIPGNTNADLGDLRTSRRRAGVPLRRRRHELDRPHRRAAGPADQRDRGRLRERATGSGSPPTSASTRARRRRELDGLLQRPAQRVRRRPGLPSARPRAARGDAQPRRLGDPGRRLDDRSRICGVQWNGSSPATRRGAGSPSAGRRPGTSSGRSCRRRRARAAPQVTWNVQVERAERRVRHLLDHRQQPHPRSRSPSRVATASSAATERGGDEHVDRNVQCTGTLAAQRLRALVHLRLARRPGTSSGT